MVPRDSLRYLLLIPLTAALARPWRTDVPAAQELFARGPARELVCMARALGELPRPPEDLPGAPPSSASPRQMQAAEAEPSRLAPRLGKPALSASPRARKSVDPLP
ncbi:MAG: hypothetical protein AAB320_04500 [Elusimicrobiota bacterium]